MAASCADAGSARLLIFWALSDRATVGAAIWSRREARTWVSKSEIFAEVSAGMSVAERVVPDVTRPLASVVTFA